MTVSANYHCRGSRVLAALAAVVLAGACSSTTRQSAPTEPDSSPGVTADSILVGIPYVENANNRAIGAGGVTVGNAKADAQIVIDDINAHGGVAGRKLVPIFYAIPTTGGQDPTQAECTHFTKDKKVFVILTGGSPDYMECVGKAGVVLISDNLLDNGAERFRRFPFWVVVGAMNLDRIAKAEVAALTAQDYFTPWNTATGEPGGSATKVGIVTVDDPEYAHAVDKVMVPELRRAGQATPDIVRISIAGDANAITAAIKNAVLRFRTNQVDHVIIFESRGAGSLFFTKESAAQNYHPRYAAASTNAFQLLIDGAGVPKEQFKGAVGLGWIPLLDLPYAKNPVDGPYSNQARRQCKSLMTAGGQQFPDANAEAVAATYCNSLYLLRAALKTQGGQVSRRSFLKGLHSLGSKFEAVRAHGTRFSPEQHDGSAGYYHYAYDQDCGCFGYTGKLQQAE